MSTAEVIPLRRVHHPVASWIPGAEPPAFDADAIARVVAEVREPVFLLTGHDGHSHGVGVALGGAMTDTGEGYRLLGTLPPLFPEWLGDRSFCETHCVRCPYVAGEMANGIATPAMVIAMARAEMLGFYGAGGLAPSRVEADVDELVRALGDAPNWGVNLIHSPNESAIENRVAELLIERRVPIVSASAFMDLTPAVVRCAVAALRLESGEVVRARRVFAKVSRTKVAAKFMAPAPDSLLRVLLDRGQITAEEAALAARVPVAEDITVESDSGGHTDNWPLMALLPTILSLRDELAGGYARPVRVGAAGWLGTPRSGGRGVRARRGLCGHRVGESVLCGGRSFLGSQGDARQGRSRGRDHGARGRHVLAGREAAGAPPGHDVRAARRSALRDVPVVRKLGRDPRSGACPA